MLNIFKVRVEIVMLDRRGEKKPIRPKLFFEIKIFNFYLKKQLRSLKSFTKQPPPQY